MSVLSSGAIQSREAIEWGAGEPCVTSILFGASSRQNIECTVRNIGETGAARVGDGKDEANQIR
jgi:hypothetical protein